MKKFTLLNGLVVPLDRANVDTDAIIPKQFLKSIKRSGFGPNLFDEWRYLDHGEPGRDNSKRPLNPDFVLNQSRYKGAQILLARENFGCGSSREHAPWAIKDAGYHAIIAPTFADIFRANCYKTGILAVTLPDRQVRHLIDLASEDPSTEITVDLEAQEVRGDGFAYSFEIDQFERDMLLGGLDEITLVERHAVAIGTFESQRPSWLPTAN